MPFHKEKLSSELYKRGWEVVDADLQGIDWSAQEHWRLRSVRECWGVEIVVTFQHIGDPSETDLRDPTSEIVATIEMPTPGYERSTIARCRYRRHFDRQLPSFLDELDEYRRSSSRTGEP